MEDMQILNGIAIIFMTVIFWRVYMQVVDKIRLALSRLFRKAKSTKAN